MMQWRCATVRTAADAMMYRGLDGQEREQPQEPKHSQLRELRTPAASTWSVCVQHPPGPIGGGRRHAGTGAAEVASPLHQHWGGYFAEVFRGEGGAA